MIELKLPELRKDTEGHNYWEIGSIDDTYNLGVDVGFNKCLAEVKKLNPSGWEVDEEALANVLLKRKDGGNFIFIGKLEDQPEEIKKFFLGLSRSIALEQAKWLKPVNEVKGDL